MNTTSLRAAAVVGLALLILVCNEDEPAKDDGSTVTYTEERKVCKDRDPHRNLYWGDFHAHSTRSWDAFGYNLTVTPADSYRFAKGGTVMLPPLDKAGKGTRPVKLARPLDFAAITDHAEFLGETHLCRTPGSATYNSESCKAYRVKGALAVTAWGMQLVSGFGQARMKDICGADGKHCLKAAATVWQEIQQAAESAYDRTSTCGFVSFVGYEYSASPKVSNQHRNIIFRNKHVPTLPITYYESHKPHMLWKDLMSKCIESGTGCDAVVITHNSNWSNGNLYDPDQVIDGVSGTTLKEALELRRRVEPVMEMFQHKGDMECRNGLSGLAGDKDPHCDFEKLRPDPVPDCGEGTGFGGVQESGCMSRLDFLRGVLAKGMQVKESLGFNPYQLGIIGSTDTHNGTPGNTWESTWPGHVGNHDDTPEERLSEGNMTHRALINNPGGLAGVWAVEKSRDAIFQAFRRKEIYATSGTRIQVRFFGGWGYEAKLCQASTAKMAAGGYESGVPMGSRLPGKSSGSAAPSFLVWAKYDPGTSSNPGAELQLAQVVKIWVDAGGKAHQKVFDVVGNGKNGATVDQKTCKRSGAGQKVLCTTWTDPQFKASEQAAYYARVIENPSCRWSTQLCNTLASANRPKGCDSKTTPKVIQERAWSSPIWYAP